MKHDWHMIIEFSNGESVDRIWYCKSCGVVKKTYIHRNGSADPVYFGVDVEPNTLDVPSCGVGTNAEQDIKRLWEQIRIVTGWQGRVESRLADIETALETQSSAVAA